MNVIKVIANVNPKVIQITFELPVGFTAEELVELTRKDIRRFIKTEATYGKTIRLFGRMTTGMCLLMGHELSHVCQRVEIFDPKENVFYTVIKH